MKYRNDRSGEIRYAGQFGVIVLMLLDSIGVVVYS